MYGRWRREFGRALAFRGLERAKVRGRPASGLSLSFGSFGAGVCRVIPGRRPARRLNSPSGYATPPGRAAPSRREDTRVRACVRRLDGIDEVSPHAPPAPAAIAQRTLDEQRASWQGVARPECDTPRACY